MTRTFWSRRVVTIAAVLFLLVLLPVQSQTPSPSEPPIRRTTRKIVVPTTPSGRGNAARFVVARQPTPTITPSPSSIPQITEIIRFAKTATLEVSPSPQVEVGLQAQFEVVFPQPRLAGWNLQYLFDFGDGHRTNWSPERQATHTYSSPAPRIYPVYAEIGVKYRDIVKPIRKIDSKVQVVPQLKPTPTSTATSIPITPSPTSSYTPPATPSGTASVPIRSSPYSPSPTATVLDGSITATPPPSTNNVASPTATRSPPKHYTATPTPVLPNGGSESQRSWWIFYIVSGLAAAALYVILKLIKPTFHPHADWHEPQKPPQNVAINYGLYFHSNVSAGQDRLQTNGARLILRKRTQ